jgi:amino acid transporter
MSTAAHHVDEDTQQLHKLGYAQELFRSMGGFQNFAISFTIISILAGCLTSYSIAWNQGGPVAITWGWLIVGLFCIFVALALAEIASTYPTAGGLYFWSSKLGSPAWGWFTGWFNLIGQIAVTAAIGFGCAIFMTSLLNLLFDYPNSYGWIYFMYGLIMLGAGIINMFKVPITAFLNSISAWWHMVGVVVVVFILGIVPDHHKSISFVFGETVNATGFGGQS